MNQVVPFTCYVHAADFAIASRLILNWKLKIEKHVECVDSSHLFSLLWLRLLSDSMSRQMECDRNFILFLLEGIAPLTAQPIAQPPNCISFICILRISRKRGASCARIFQGEITDASPAHFTKATPNRSTEPKAHRINQVKLCKRIRCEWIYMHFDRNTHHCIAFALASNIY